MGFTADDRRRLNSEEWNRQRTPVVVPHVDERNDYKDDHCFDITLVNDKNVLTIPHKYVNKISEVLSEMILSGVINDDTEITLKYVGKM